MKVWIARNKDGRLNFWAGERPHIPEPHEGEFANSNYKKFLNPKAKQIPLPRGMFPKVTYDNSPQIYTVIKEDKT